MINGGDQWVGGVWAGRPAANPPGHSAFSRSHATMIPPFQVMPSGAARPTTRRRAVAQALSDALDGNGLGRDPFSRG